MVGVDVKAQSRERNSQIATELGWTALSFVAGTIASASVPFTPDVVLALHACDTATDEALARAVHWRSPVVLAAPCCHHDLQRQLRETQPPPSYGLVMQHGILRERMADVLTDALRATLLRLMGYRVDVVEFVSSEHTSRNVAIRAVRTGAAADPGLVAQYRALTATWGLRPALAVRLSDDLTARHGGEW
jgi:hypothetical protein